MTGTGAGVFTDLGFNFTAVDGGTKCTDTEDLKVNIEVLSNEMVTTGEDVSLIVRFAAALIVVFRVLLPFCL